MIKILQLISSGGFFGAENVLLELSVELRNLGHSVTIGIFNNLHKPNLELIEKARARSLNIIIFECNGKFDLKAVSGIGSYVKENLIGIIHTHGYKSNIYAVLSNIRNRRVLVTTCHNWINSNAKMGFYAYLDRAFLKWFDAVVPVSRTVKEFLLESGVRKERINLIENGIDVSRFNSKEKDKGLLKRLGLAHGCKVIGTVGRLSEEKGHTYFLKAAKKIMDSFGDCFFLIVGEGPLRKDLEGEARMLGINDRVVFTGKRNDIPELLSVMDIFVLPSLTEGQPVALLEAMASGRAIAATDVGDVRKILKDGELGLIVPPKNPGALAEKILLYLNDKDRAKDSGLNAHSEALEKYSSARMAGEYLRVYKNVSV